MWEPDCTNEPVEKVDCQQITESKQREYRETRITNKLKVTKHRQSTSEGIQRKIFQPETYERMYPKGVCTSGQ